MKILVTNDDGIDAPGLTTLVRRLSEIGEVYVCAPAYQQSAKSMSLTLTEKIRLERKEVDGAREAYAVVGSPVDTVILALTALGLKPDVVVSGINEGYNMGRAALYSGTIGAAKEALCDGIPAVAVSLDCDFTTDQHDYSYAADVAAKVIPYYLNSPLKDQALVSINVPEKEIKGIRWTRMSSKGHFEIFYKLEENEDGLFARRYDYTRYQDDPSERSRDYDWFATRDGYVTLTPIDLGQVTEVDPGVLFDLDF